MSPRRAGALIGAAAGAELSLLLLLFIQVQNPWFEDSPALYLGLVAAPLALLCALPGVLFGPRLSPAVARAFGRPAGLLLGMTLGLVLILGPLWPRPSPSGRVRLLVLGLDGATFERLDALELPALSRLATEGARADLMSMEPMFSPLLWTTMASGKPPEQHGIHGFHVQATDCKAARFWDVMSDAGLSVGTWKWLVTYPPTRLAAFQIPAWLAPSTETWPPDYQFVKEIELSRRSHRRQVAQRRGTLRLAWEGVRHGMRMSTLARAARYRLSEALLGPDPLRSYYEGQLLRVEMDRDVFVYALHTTSPEVVTFTDYATDAIAHKFWKFHEPDRFPGVDPALVSRWGEAVNDSYRQADQLLAELREEVGPGATVVVLSDHGHRALTAVGEGIYFTPKTERLQARLSAEVGPADVTRLGHKLVVGLTGPDPAAEEVALVAWLDRLTLSSTGEPFYRLEDIPENPQAVGLSLRRESIGKDELERATVGGDPLHDYVKRVEDESGEHDARGVFLAAGPGLVTGRSLPALRLFDVAPTLLALVGLPAAEDMPGAVAEGLWERPPVLPSRPASYDRLVPLRPLESGEAGINEEQLKLLGYIE